MGLSLQCAAAAMVILSLPLAAQEKKQPELVQSFGKTIDGERSAVHLQDGQALAAHLRRRK
jgi:hypothetical protein